MLRKNLGLFITLGVVLILFGYGCNGYNGLVTSDQEIKKFILKNSTPLIEQN